MNEHEEPTPERPGATPGGNPGGSPGGSPGDSPSDRGDATLDFFGASAPSTLPVPSAPPPALPSAAPAAPDVTGPGSVRRGVRVRTLVFGLVMLAVSAATLLALLTSVHVDSGVVALGLLIGAGGALFLGGLTAAFRDMHRATRTGT